MVLMVVDIKKKKIGVGKFDIKCYKNYRENTYIAVITSDAKDG